MATTKANKQLDSVQRRIQRLKAKLMVMARWEQLGGKKKLSLEETKEYRELDRKMKQYIRNMIPRVRMSRIRV